MDDLREPADDMIRTRWLPVRQGREGGLHFGGILRKGISVDERLKDLMQELGNAINESLSESERIAASIDEIRRAGYEVFLVLEATIGFNKCQDEEQEAAHEADESGAKPRREFRTAGKFKWTSQDQRFLREMKIAVDEDRSA